MFNAFIDRSGVLQEMYRETQQLDSYLYVLCTKGECTVNVYTSERTIPTNSLITLLPNSYLRVSHQKPDTELYVVSFKHVTLSSANLFAKVAEHITRVVEFPVADFDPNTIEIMCDYVRLLMRIRPHVWLSENSDFASTIFTQFTIIIGKRYKLIKDTSFQADRSRMLVVKFMQLITTYYQSERSAAFYAQKMNISPQHLSAVVKRVTQRTITDIIAMFVIIDAQTKLVSTDLSIGEIATTLNFDDVSVFGRYFKRYTKLSPRQYRRQ
ncbi:MAG: helix-turn-helix domain-containing protein [Rikenellaceae bacterium]